MHTEHNWTNNATLFNPIQYPKRPRSKPNTSMFCNKSTSKSPDPSCIAATGTEMSGIQQRSRSWILAGSRETCWRAAAGASTR